MIDLPPGVGLADLIDRGIVVAAGGHLYARCADCGRTVRIDKPLVGSLHVCVGGGEDEG